LSTWTYVCIYIYIYIYIYTYIHGTDRNSGSLISCPRGSRRGYIISPVRRKERKGDRRVRRSSWEKCRAYRSLEIISTPARGPLRFAAIRGDWADFGIAAGTRDSGRSRSRDARQQINLNRRRASYHLSRLVTRGARASTH